MQKLLIILTSITLTACSNDASRESSSIGQPYFQNELIKAKSPDGKRQLTLTELCFDDTSCQTQVLLDFGRTASGVYATNGKNLGINSYWKGNNTIVIKTKKAYPAQQKWPEVQSLGDKVKVEYIEE